MRISPTRWQTGATIGILVLSTISSLLGLFREGHYTDSVDGLLRIHAQDAVLLGIGVPVLAIGLLYTRRGSHCGRLIWLGTLAYMAYMWITLRSHRSVQRLLLGIHCASRIVRFHTR